MVDFTLPRGSRDLDWTGERFIPGLGGEIEFEHLHRYLFASQFCEGMTVLDIASGEGYGTYMLSQVAALVIGVDIDPQAVAHASKTYASDNLSYRVGSVAKIPAENATFDVVVSFETLEHVVEHKEFLDEARRVLKPGGVLVMSTPNKTVYMHDEENHYHLLELTREEFVDFIQARFAKAVFADQKATAGSVIVPHNAAPAAAQIFHRERGDAIVSAPALKLAPYVVAVASDSELPPIQWSMLDEADFLRHVQTSNERAQEWATWAFQAIKPDPRFLSACLYSRSDVDVYREETADHKPVLLGLVESVCELRTPLYERGIEEVRLDISEDARRFILHRLEARRLNGELLFQWDGSPDFINGGLRMEASVNARGEIEVACGEDPQLPIPLETGGDKPSAVVVTFAVTRAGSGSDSIEGQVAEIAEGQADLAKVVSGIASSIAEQAAAPPPAPPVDLEKLRRENQEALDAATTRSIDAVSYMSASQERALRRFGEAIETSLAQRIEGGIDRVVEQVAEQAVAPNEQIASLRDAVDRAHKDVQGGIAEVRDEVSLNIAAIGVDLQRDAEYRASDLARRLESVSRKAAEAAAEAQALRASQDALLGRLDALTSAVMAQNDMRAEFDRLRGVDERVRRAMGLPNASDGELVMEIARLRTQLLHRDNQVQALLSSTSWRISAPVRAIKRLVKGEAAPVLPAPEEPAAAPAPAPAKHNRFGDTTTENGGRPITALEPVAPQVVALTQAAPLEAPPVRLLAFYLPQFHPIPENNAWWGEGFTEWTNVAPAKSQFVGHYQPHVPGELGYYDLRDPQVQKRQAELADLYGVSGFCFYFYWFAGKTLLETPLIQYAENEDISKPFVICWANENWSRRWDGLDQELLIAQDHSPEDDLAFIAHAAQYLRNPKYIRVNGKPMLIVYRPNLLPDPVATAGRWRDWCRKNGVGEIHLAYVQSFEAVDPGVYDFDAAIEFPPNNTAPPNITDHIERINPDFSGVVYDYTVYPERSQTYAEPSYPLYRGVFPSWDNEARRKGKGAVFAGSTPALYKDWLTNAVRDTVERFSEPSQRLVFVNAWNEWAEGAHLEPDERYGYAWLQATREAMETVQGELLGQRLMVVTHDCYLHGAQFLTLNIIKTLATELGCHLDIVTLGDGPLKTEFARYGVLHDFSGLNPEGMEAQALCARLKADGVHAALTSTSVAGLFLGVASRAGMRTVALIHELAGIISDYKLERHVATIAAEAEVVVFPSETVKASFESFAELPAKKAVIRPQGNFKRNASRTPAERAEAALRLRKRLGLAADAEVVIGVGYGDRRKGVDLFVKAAIDVIAARPKAVFAWLGLLEAKMEAEARALVAEAGLERQVMFVGFQSDTDDFYAGADVFALTSREDPFPMVLLESLEAGTPAVGFEGAGGFVDLLRSGGGLLAEAFSAADFAGKVTSLLADDEQRRAIGLRGEELALSDYAFGPYVQDLLHMMQPGRGRVSVVVPNYNYERFMVERLESVDRQTAAPYEIIVLDDKSTDGSVAEIRRILPGLRSAARLSVNEQNSGSVFAQWRKGVAQAKGDLVWIAEADDLSDPEFLEATIEAFRDPGVVMSYAQSKQMAQDGSILADDYLGYVADLDQGRWTQSYVAEGLDEIRAGMAIKNVIPNVSGVVFRRDVLLDVLDKHFDEIKQFKVAGDWFVYVKLLERGKVAFTSRSLNLHRRHAGSVTLGSFGEAQLREIVSMQNMVLRGHEVPAEVAERARGYAQELYTQFGLGEGPQARIVDDAKFKELMS
ncbi:glycoside hydrolase family 99-like domain-containing protein [Caulobacter hibisci]|uniref:Glycoside hydrolase family 99-like domain-containing protein n=1 Tax=Caulobacter hibisci TaxID=2035993 RepID=A0ABS0SX60_9CAUL|nr:glycoside hydrolase family 99-like domain-containing protein [Caulobacter hibisci]MBI1683293.1 glycoside hydrolase family 99-like domain-containing protein [Caulobacter hibisci]